MIRPAFLLLAFAGLSFGHLRAQQFEGADAILDRILEPAVNKAALQKKVKAFENESDLLSPEEAARQWLAIWDAFNAIPIDGSYDEINQSDAPLMGKAMMAALPAPAAWNPLAAALEKRAGTAGGLRPEGLRLFAAVLRGDMASQKQAIKTLIPIAEEYKRQDFGIERLLTSLDGVNTLAASAGHDADRLSAFEKQLGKIEKPDKQALYPLEKVTIPDLVGYAGQEAATPLIVRALRLGKSVEVKGAATRSLSVSLALREIDSLKKPHWNLVTRIEDLPLYEALAKKFPDPQEKRELTNERNSTSPVYLMALIAANRINEAVAFTKDADSRKEMPYKLLSDSALESMQRRGLSPQVLGFLRELLARNPELSFWKDFIRLSARQNDAPGALAFLRQTMQRADLTRDARAEVESHYAMALLGAGEVEEGVRILRASIASPEEKSGNEGSDSRSNAMTSSGHEKQALLGLKLVDLGRLLARPEWVEEGLAIARVNARLVVMNNSDAVTGLRKALLQLGRASEAEKMVASQIKEEFEQAQGRTEFSMPDELASLAFVYDQAGRPEDVVRLLDRSPWWGAMDLAALTYIKVEEMPLLLIAARALAATGHKQEAANIARFVIRENPQMDTAYSLLLQLGGNDLETYLDHLYSADRFEERPLIWKAKLQFDAGRIDEAEKTIRAAIAIDPSDGEQGKGDRMRAYAILGDILEKKGDAAQAGIMRGAVAAIRLSEEADEWWEAGLLSHAVGMYEEALLRFADAYCIQSRLALRCSELGDFDKAEQYYRRAFELMPESFGRVESHCFGCEGVFEGERAQGIAEKVFTSLAEKMPNRPQVFYLLGYLRDEQGRHEEAAGFFRKAVQLDPDYLNAWEKLWDLTAHID
ncbi:MAG: tetratricopeptide repeat protein, partial [Verrucomicrobiota bacterium]